MLDAALNRILTPDFMQQLLAETRRQFNHNPEQEAEMKTLQHTIQKLERAIHNLLNLVENGTSALLAARLQEREAELQARRERLRLLEAQRASARVEVTPEMLQAAIARWRERIETARLAEDIQTIKRLLFPGFVTEVRLAYNQVTIRYGFPLELQAGAVQNHFSVGMLETTYKTQRKRRGAPRRCAGPPRRDLEIYQRHTAGETVRSLAGAYFLSEKRVWGICTAVRKFLRKSQPPTNPPNQEHI